MANILILGAKVPFTRGGQEALLQSLSGELSRQGHCVDTVELPFSVHPKETLLNQAALWRSIDFSSFGGKRVDLVIATKFPCYYARHSCKSIWLVHQRREIYDLFGGRFSDFSDDVRDEVLRQQLYQGDQKVIAEASYIAGISKNVCQRLQQYNQIAAEALYPPLPLGNRYYCGQQDDYILSVGRLCSIKRVDLMIKAMPGIYSSLKLKIAGVADEPTIMDYYRNEIAKHHLNDRVEFLGRVSDQELIDLYANSMAVYYAPYDEDYGYVTLEAFASRKPVVAGSDSGGVLEFVEHEKNGLVVEPDSDAIARGINRLVEDRAWSAKLGQAGRELVESLQLTTGGWDTVVEKLTSPLKARSEELQDV